MLENNFPVSSSNSPPSPLHASLAAMLPHLTRSPTIFAGAFSHVDDFASHLSTFTLPASALLTIAAPSNLAFNEFLVLAQISFERLPTGRIVIYDELMQRFAIRDEAGTYSLWDLTAKGVPVM